MDKQQSVWTTLLEIFFQAAGCRSMSENVSKNHFFSKWLFFSNCSVGHVDGGSDIHTGKISTKVQFFLLCPKAFRKTFRGYKISNKTFFCTPTENAKFDNPAEQFLQACRKKLTHCPKLIEKEVF